MDYSKKIKDMIVQKCAKNEALLGTILAHITMLPDGATRERDSYLAGHGIYVSGKGRQPNPAGKAYAAVVKIAAEVVIRAKGEKVTNESVDNLLEKVYAKSGDTFTHPTDRREVLDTAKDILANVTAHVVKLLDDVEVKKEEPKNHKK